MRPPITPRCLKTIFCPLKTNIQKGVLFRRPRSAVQNARNGFPSCETEKDNFRDSQGTWVESLFFPHQVYVTPVFSKQ